MGVADDEMDSYQNVLPAVLQFAHCTLTQSRRLQAHVRSQHARFQARRPAEELSMNTSTNSWVHDKKGFEVFTWWTPIDAKGFEISFMVDPMDA